MFFEVNSRRVHEPFGASSRPIMADGVRDPFGVLHRSAMIGSDGAAASRFDEVPLGGSVRAKINQFEGW